MKIKNAILAEIIKRTYIEGRDPFNEFTKQKVLPTNYHIEYYVAIGWC